MDTRFWGPPAWILFHTLTYEYKPELKLQYHLFFDNLKYVLPCIYCRASFTEYTERLPIDSHLKNRDDLFSWLYRIHNMVNDKLRGQGLISWENPELDDVKNKYKDSPLVVLINQESVESRIIEMFNPPLNVVKKNDKNKSSKSGSSNSKTSGS